MYMSTVHMPRVVIAGTNSGVGKTTIVAGLLAAYRKMGRAVQSFKVGPDYIDPGFHKMASGRDSYNLDTWLVPQERLVPFFQNSAADADVSIVEGVMGLYDGGREGVSSTAQIAKTLQAPVVLVIDCKAMGESAAAIAKGFRDYDPEVNFAGVILNRLGSDNHERMIRDGLAKVHIPVIGAIRRDDRMQSPERHLGLTPVTEFDPTDSINTICDAVQVMVDLDTLYSLADAAPDLEKQALFNNPVDSNAYRPNIGIAFDEAFSFYYPASLAALEAQGANLVYFSPLKDSHVPDVDGLVFGGGFPEMFLEQLANNQAMKASIQEAAAKRMPIYAECGGLMYMCQSIVGFDGSELNMVGLVQAKTIMQEKLQRVGYVTATAKRNSILLPAGQRVRGHEFHFSTMEPTVEDFPWAFTLEGGRKPQSYLGGYANDTILASYLHLNFAGSDQGVQRFVDMCRIYDRQKEV